MERQRICSSSAIWRDYRTEKSGRLSDKKPMLMDRFLDFAQDLADGTEQVFERLQLFDEVREDAGELIDRFRY